MEMTTHPPKLYWKTCGALMLLLTLTWSIGYVDLGMLNLIVALAISVTKALLVALFFMHIKGAHEKLLKLVVISTIFFLILLLTLSMADYGTRHWS